MAESPCVPVENVVRRAPDRQCFRCAFTGSRPQSLPFLRDAGDARCADLLLRLRTEIERLIRGGYGHFLSGGAMGVDTLAAETVLALREKYPWIRLEMVSPFDGQSALWTADWRARHDRLLRAADIVTATGHAYHERCMYDRNRYLVDNADLLLAVWDGVSGGTAMTVHRAERMGVKTLRVPPLRLAG